MITISLSTLHLSQVEASSDQPLGSFVATDGTVDAVAETAGIIYIGGNFNIVGPPIGRGTVIDLTTGVSDSGFPDADGNIVAVVPDGSGGWFIGGFFTSVGGLTRNRLAHILSNKSVDANWNPGADNTVWTMVLSPDGSTLYVGGEYHNIAGVPRNRLAALDTTTGVASAWDPNSNWHVYSLALTANGATLYVGGFFTSIGGQTRNEIAAIDTSTGLATTWNPNSDGNWIRALALSADESTVYVGGKFQSLGGQVRQKIAAISSITGLATAWDPNTGGTTPEIRTIVVSGSSIYAGGAFSQIGGQTRNNIAELDATTGLATAWNPNADSNVLAMAVAGSTVYAAGDFLNMGGQPRWNIAALDATTGLATTWASQADLSVKALAINGTGIYAGGNFSIIGGALRNDIAAINATTGQPTSWNPNADDAVDALALSADGSTVYVGGLFGTIGGQSRYGLAELSATTGNATAWDPGACGNLGFPPKPLVSAIIVSGSTIYVGGRFDSFNGTLILRNRLAALDATTALPSAWDPNADSDVTDMLLAGNTLYVAGTFINVGGAARNRIAAIDTNTGNATSWNPNADAEVKTLDISGSTLYAGGSFTNIGGQARNRIAALDTTTGLATGWNPNADNVVNAIVLDAANAYVGGSFTNIGSLARNRLALLDLATGQACPDWDPNANADVSIVTILASGLQAGGSFTTLAGSSRQGYAVFNMNSAPTSIAATVTTNQDSTISGSLVASDANNDALTYSLAINGQLGTAVITNAATGAYTYTPIAGVNGADSFTFKVSDGCAESNVATVTVTISAPSAPQNQAATFTLTTTVTPSGAGSVTRLPDAQSYASGTTVTLTETPAAGFRFVKWTGDLSGLSESGTLAVDADKTVQAEFATLAMSDADTVNDMADTQLSVQRDSGEPLVDIAIMGGSAGSSVVVVADETDNGVNGSFAGFADGQGINRAIMVSTNLAAGTFTALLEMFYTDAELGNLDDSQLRLFRWNPATNQWDLAATRDMGVSAPTGAVGDYGVDTANKRVWASVDHFSTFSIGKTVQQASNAIDPTILSPLCGACAPVSPLILMFTVVTFLLIRRRNFWNGHKGKGLHHSDE